MKSAVASNGADLIRTLKDSEDLISFGECIFVRLILLICPLALYLFFGGGCNCICNSFPFKDY